MDCRCFQQEFRIGQPISSLLTALSVALLFLIHVVGVLEVVVVGVEAVMEVVVDAEVAVVAVE